MGLTRGRLKPRMIPRLPEGKHSDGGGLYLRVAGGSRLYYARFTYEGRGYELSLGSAYDIDLDEAREAVAEAKRKVRLGLDPTVPGSADMPTLKQMVRRYYVERWLPAAIERRGDVGKYQNQWIEDFERHVFPNLGDRQLDRITPPVLYSTFEPKWRDIHDTAQKLLQRLSVVFDFAVAIEVVTVNPCASTRAALGRSNSSGGHFAAIPWQWAPDFYSYLSDERRNTAQSYAMRLLMLTGMRTSEVMGLRWREVEPTDPLAVGLAPGTLDSLSSGTRSLVVLPPTRHKAGARTGQPVVVVLSPDARQLLVELRHRYPGEVDDLVFPQSRQRRDAPISANACANTLKKATDPRYRAFTAHGMRSTLADYLKEVHGISREDRRRILHQSTGDKVDAAYFRSPMLARSHQLLSDWADLLHRRRVAEVVDLTKRA